jgi:hypothetical protein
MKIRSLLVTIALLIAIAIILLQRSQISKLSADLQATHPSSDAATDNSLETNKSAAPPSTAASADSAELLRLRAEVAALRKQTNELSRVRAENLKMREALTLAKTAPTTQGEPPSDAERAQAIARLNDSRIYALALLMHVQDNQRFATNMEELAPYLGTGNPPTGTNEFDIMFQGARNDVTNSSGTILVREHQPHQRADGRWTRAYGFLDGHAEVHTEPTSNFDDFEREHMWPPRQ